MNLQFRRQDGSYVAEINGLPYHVVEDDPHWQAALDAVAELGEPPAEPIPSPANLSVEDFWSVAQVHSASTDFAAIAKACDAFWSEALGTLIDHLSGVGNIVTREGM